jgi:hypothetical protein
MRLRAGAPRAPPPTALAISRVGQNETARMNRGVLDLGRSVGWAILFNALNDWAILFNALND